MKFSPPFTTEAASSDSRFYRIKNDALESVMLVDLKIAALKKMLYTVKVRFSVDGILYEFVGTLRIH